MKIALLFTFLLHLLATESIAQNQKIKIKNDYVTVDESQYVKWQQDFVSNSVSVYTLGSDEEIIFFRWRSYNTSKVSDSSTRGNWVEVKFVNENLVYEINNRGQKGLVRFLLANNLIENGDLNVDATKKIVQKFGNEFSENRPQSIIVTTVQL